MIMGIKLQHALNSHLLEGRQTLEMKRRVPPILIALAIFLAPAGNAQTSPESRPKNGNSPSSSANPIPSSGSPPPSQRNGLQNGAGKIGQPDYSKPYGYHLQPILSAINADQTQSQKISQIVGSYRSRLEPLRETCKQKQRKLLDGLVDGSSSESIMSCQLEVGQLHREISSQYCMMSLEIRRLLNPDQIVKYESYKREQGWSK